MWSYRRTQRGKALDTAVSASSGVIVSKSNLARMFGGRFCFLGVTLVVLAVAEIMRAPPADDAAPRLEFRRRLEGPDEALASPMRLLACREARADVVSQASYSATLHHVPPSARRTPDGRHNAAISSNGRRDSC